MSAEPAENLPVDLARNPVFRKRWKKPVDLQVSHQGNLLPTIRRRDRKRRCWPWADGCSYHGSLRTSGGLVQAEGSSVGWHWRRWACCWRPQSRHTRTKKQKSPAMSLQHSLSTKLNTVQAGKRKIFKGPDTFSQSRGKKKRINLELRGNKLTPSTIASTIL